MNLLKNRAFCVLPFIEEFQDVNGVCKVCCYSHTPIDTINSVETNALRQQILEGNPIPHCQSCYKLEQNKTISPRIRESIRWLRDPEIKSYIENWSPEKLQTFYYDIRFDNKCNLACISCGPDQSSLWEKELGQTKSTLLPRLDIDRLLTAKKLYLAGGEPLIIDQFKDLLQAVAAQSVQPEIVINTNLTRVSNEIAQTLGQIKNLTLTVSVDAFEKVNEYHRWPSRWDKFMRNLEWAKEIGCTIHFNSVVDAVTVINIDQLVKIEHLADMWTLTNLTTPPALCVNNLPTDLKPEITQRFEKIKLSRFYNQDPVFHNQINAVIKSIAQPGEPELLSMYIDQIDHRRQLDHVQYLGIKLT